MTNEDIIREVLTNVYGRPHLTALAALDALVAEKARYRKVASVFYAKMQKARDERDALVAERDELAELVREADEVFCPAELIEPEHLSERDDEDLMDKWAYRARAALSDVEDE